jgi:hypothetical protein
MSPDASSPDQGKREGDTRTAVFLGHRLFTLEEIACDSVRVLESGLLWRILDVHATARLVTYVHESSGETRRRHADSLVYVAHDPAGATWWRRATPGLGE